MGQLRRPVSAELGTATVNAGIFAAVDGIRPGDHMYKVLRWMPVEDLVPSPVDSEQAPSSGEYDELGRSLPRSPTRRRRTRRRRTSSSSSSVCPATENAGSQQEESSEQDRQGDETNFMQQRGLSAGLLPVVQSIDIRLGQLPVP